MSWAWLEWRRAPIDVYLASNSTFACRGADVLLHEAAQDEDHALGILARWLIDAPAARKRLWLSGALCPSLLVDPVPGLKNQQEALEVARARAGELTGLVEPCEVWIDRFAKDAPLVGAAMSARLHCALLRLTARASETRPWQSIRPWWAEVLRVHAAPAPAAAAAAPVLSVRDTDALTWVRGRQQRIEVLTSYSAITTVEQARAARLRAAVSVNDDHSLEKHWELVLDEPAAEWVDMALGCFVREVA